MGPMNSLNKTGIMANLRNRKGFSLIEMAIVLVIIGVIIGAIIKGQDLILNSRAKQVSTAVLTWRNLAAAYLDRNGRLPGDFGKDGRIGNTAASEQIATGTAIAEIEAGMANTPANPVIVGGMSFYVYFGEVPGSTLFRNVLVVCKDVACATVFTPDELEVIKTIDTAIDGGADGGLGQFRAATGVTLTGQVATAGGRAADVITAAAGLDNSAAGATAPWGVTAKAAVWSFDRPF